MGTLDFLFEGQAPPSVTTYGSTVQNLPQWMSDYTQGLLGRANAIAAEPYQPYTGPRIAGFTPDINQAFQMTRNNLGSAQNILNQGTNSLAQAYGVNPLATAQPYMNTASGALSSGLRAGESSANDAMGYMRSAGNATYPGAASAYMNPYMDNVINRSAQLATRNFQENLLPGIQDMFTANGMYGSTPMAEKVMRGARDVTENIQSQSNAALADAYKSGADQFNSDQSRMLQAGSSLGALGQNYSNQQINAASQFGNLGQLAGTLDQQRGQMQLDLAGKFGTLAEQLNRLNVSDAAGLEAIGNREQALNQSNLDTAYQDFQNQTNYPRSTVDWMSSVIRGLQSPLTTTTTTTAPATSTSRSPLEQLGGLAAILRGLQPQTNTSST